jgi:ATP-dependent 26S proteasome regulatory subunit
MRVQRQNQSSEEKEKRLAKNRTYRKLKETKGHTLNSHVNVNNMTELIKNFHDSISTGPLYVCSCCEQLWYKHNVCPAEIKMLLIIRICRNVTIEQLMNSSII